MSYRAAAKNVSFVFGIINFPVKLYLAGGVEDYEFKRITTSGNKMKEKAVDEKSGEEVVRAQHYKGIILPDKSNVIFSDEEIATLRGGNPGIFIAEFVSESSIDNIYYSGSYYISPEKGGEVAFKSFSLALGENDGMVGIGKWNTATRENLVVIRPYRGGMLLHTIFYKNEIRPYEDNTNVDVSLDVVNATLKLIKEKNIGNFDSSRYKNSQVQRIANAIALKTGGQPIDDGGLMKILESAIKQDTCETEPKPKTTKKQSKNKSN